jgi:hypothetical protein
MNIDGILQKKYSESQWKKLAEYRPHLLGVQGGIQFFEHPIHGDESPVIAKCGNQVGLSWFYEVPAPGEMEDAIERGSR